MGNLDRRIYWQTIVPIRWRRWRVTSSVSAGDEVPASIPPGGAVLVEVASMPTWIAFDCPCGRGHRVMLNLNQSRRPRWTLRSRSPLTVSPSVDTIHDGRRCHYFLEHGRVVWVREKRKARK